ncbi:MAG: Gfo/Idh/MocA family oxidoreductase [Lentisphaeria bacterium]|nr:Gfo/Idh/MocA family oxidoreductase [Lentisphaeria bacterium]
MSENSVFKTDKRIKLGVWGLGRGAYLVHQAKFLNIDVVAGCDIHPDMRECFAKNTPGAFVTADEDEFLAQDFDAVLIATYFKDHAKHTIKALNAGKHVMCEVTAFHTPADGVKVVEAVEKSGKVYNLLENYPFTKENMYIRDLWQKGFFGEFMYGEASYLHECRVLSYAYNTGLDGLPIEPGYHAHNWRSTLNTHYYNTHSLGPIMNITGLRPVAVSATPCDVYLPGYLGKKGTVTPSIIKMNNGALMRNLMGCTTNDYHMELRMWGTKASVEKINDLKIRVGACGGGEMLKIAPEISELQKLADQAGHGGGDFWELYYFAREILTGEPAPWNIYSAADVTLTGIMAVHSSLKDGEMVEVPDFRNKAVRDQYRNDDVYYGNAFDPENIFPEGHDPSLTGQFSELMTKLYPKSNGSGLPTYNMAYDGMKIFDNIADAEGKLRIISRVSRLIECLPTLADAIKTARKIADAYPESLPGKMLYDVLDSVDCEKICNVEQTTAELRTWLENRHKI